MGVFTFDATFRTKYQDEFKEDFEQKSSKLRMAVNTQGMINGDTAKWDVSDPADAANVRGRGGNIPESELGFSQVSATPLEHYKKFKIDSFDAFRGNPNSRSQHSKKGIRALNRSIDDVIIAAADASATAITTSTDGASNQAAALSTLARVDYWLSFLLEADVIDESEGDDMIWAVISYKAFLQMQRIAEFKSADYIERKIMPDMPGKRVLYWQGVNWLTSNRLTGKGTAACKMYMWHKEALGHLLDGDPVTHPYYYEPQDRYETWVRVRHCAKTCLPTGIVRFYHDDTAALA
jgi:Phage capsid protein